MLSDDDRELMRVVARYLRTVNDLAESEAAPQLTPLGEEISAYLRTDASTLPVVLETYVDHRLVDLDRALASLSGDGGRVIGVAGGDQRHHQSLPEFIRNGHTRYAVGPVDYAERATSDTETTAVVAFGIRLLTFGGAPLAVLQRAANPQYGRPRTSIEVISADADLVSDFLRALRAAMIEHSVLRGKVLSFVPTEFGQDAGATFLPRPTVRAEDVVLPPGTLDEVTAHVIGIGEHRSTLSAAGQHLKRGVLLYGPPGTGKTLTVRHVLAATPETTAVVLTGSSIRFIGAATEIARTFPPAIVVLEDIDLVAMERHMTPQPLLFEILDALDGLDGDADIAFIMTTNRVEVLERALAERPGRVDLAVEVPLPAAAERRRLFRHYARELPFSNQALDAAADAAEGTTGSFAKELMRRTVLRAARDGRSPTDEDLSAELERLGDSRQALTRALLGSGAQESESDAAHFGHGGSFGFFEAHGA